MITVEGVLLLAFVLLPGAHARIASLRSTPIPWSESSRSQTQELVEILFYALVNSLIAGLTLAAISVAFFDSGSILRDLIASPQRELTASQRVDVAIWVTVYLIYSIAIADLIGSAQLLARIRGLVVGTLGVVDDFTHSTVWYWALDATLKQPYRLRDVGARITLIDGRTYLGVLANYPILGNDERKDLVLMSAEKLNTSTGEFESVAGPLGRVLINSADCYAIEVGPSGAPQPYRYGIVGERLHHLIAWILVLWLSAATLGKLMARQPADNLDLLLWFVAASGVAGSVLALLRLALVCANRWDNAASQFGWLIVGGLFLSFALSLGFDLTQIGLMMLMLSLVAGLALLLAARRSVEPQLPTP